MRWGENPNRNEDDGEGDDSCKNDSTTGTGTSAVGGFRWVFDVVLCGIVATWDYARAWYQMACEMGWSFSFTTNTNNRSGWWNTATNDNSMIYNGDDDDDFDQHRRTSNVGGKSRSNRRRPLPGREATIGAKANATSARRSRCNSLPELDDCCVAGVNQQHAMDPSFESESSEYGDEGLSIGTGQAVVQKGGILDNGIIKSGFTINHRHHIRDSNEWNWTRMVRTELEPAFRNEKDYPSGWLVYHPVLRVVPKAQADLYDREYSKHEHNSTEVLKHEFPSTETNREVVNLTNGSKDPLSVEADEKNDDSAPVSSHDSLMNGWEDVVAPDAASMQGKIGNTSYTDGVSKSNEKTATTPIGAIAGATSSTSHEGLPILQSAVTT